MNKATVIEKIQSFVKKAGYLPLDLKLFLRKNTLIVSFAICKKENSVTLEDCSSVTLLVRDFLNMLFGKDADFIVDVSSPGAERELKTWEEYSLFIGKKVLIERQDGSILIARLHGVAEPDIVLLKENCDLISLPFTNILTCKLVLE